MTLQITREERDYLLDLLKAAQPELQHELHHTDTLDYRTFLRKRLELLERLTIRIDALHDA